MVLNREEILAKIKTGDIVVHPFDEENIQVNSVDVTLGENYYREVPTGRASLYDIWSKASVDKVWKQEKASLLEGRFKKEASENTKGEKVILIKPGERILCHTEEFIGGRRSVTTMMKCRSSINRSSISVCLCSGLGDIGYINRWTMEVTNHSRYYTIPLVVGRRIAQIVFFQCGGNVSTVGKKEMDYSKKGKYQVYDCLERIVKEWTPSDMLPKLYKDKEIRV